MSTFLVFDVESVGLHGEGYAVGYVVIESNGEERESGCFACDPSQCRGSRSGQEWVSKNAPCLVKTHSTPREVREAFWNKWAHWKSKGAVLAADVPWPVESRFLNSCVDDVRPVTRGGMQDGERDFQGPYPLVDIASVRVSRPLNEEYRLESELPQHDPLADARQSARLLLEALQK